MKTTLYYFSGTGNSLHIARTLAGLLGDTTLVPMTRYIDSVRVSPGNERVGLVYPVYFWGLPRLVEQFARKLDPDGVQYLFAVGNRGGSPTYGMTRLNRVFRKKGKALDYAIHVNLPSNYIVSSYYEKILPHEEKRKMMIETAGKRLTEAAGEIASGKQALSQHNILTRPLVRLVNALFAAVAARPGSDRKYYISDTCNGCGVCANACPVGNISMETGKPVWQGKCQQCMACIQFCPAKAVHFKRDCTGKTRYHHPEITAKDIGEQAS